MRRVLLVAVALTDAGRYARHQDADHGRIGRQECKAGAGGAGRHGAGIGRRGLAQHEEPDARGARGGVLSWPASGGTTEYWEYHAWPDHDRIEYTKHRDVVQFYVGRRARR